jgi:dTDP-4-dehydrorhamnose 3,5-epimerase
MNVEKTTLPGVLVLEPKVFGDHRGWFCETYSQSRMSNLGIDIIFVQDNQSLSAQKGTLRGLHFQNNPKAQTKLVRCTRGRILDVAVDIRKGSATFGQYVSVELSAENHKQLLVPKGFAHAFMTLTDDAEVQYKVDEYYTPEYDRGIRYDDPVIAIDWGSTIPILSAKDQSAPLLKDSDCNFTCE